MTMMRGGLAAVACAVLALQAGSALAQANTMSASAPAAASSGHYDLDTPIETIAADPAGKAVLDKDLPSLTGAPQYEQFKALSLKALQSYAPGKLTDERLAQTAADLKALPAK